MQLRVDLIVILTDDVPKLTAFYRDVLGVPERSDSGGDYVEFATGNVCFAVCARTELTKATAHPSFGKGRRGQSFELAFRCDTPDAVDTTYAAIVAKGATPVTPPTTLPWGQRAAFFADPEATSTNCLPIRSGQFAYTAPYARLAQYGDGVEERGMHEQGRHKAGLWCVPLLLIALLSGCAGPGGDAIVTAAALATAQGRTLSPALPAMRRDAPSPGTATAATNSPPVSPVGMSATGMGATTAISRAASAVSASPGAGASAVVPAATTGNVATTVAEIPAPPGGIAYTRGQNAALDGLLQAVDDALRPNTAGITVTTERRTHTLTTTPPAAVLDFYRGEMARRGWMEEPAAPNVTTRPGFATLVFSRDGRTVGGLIVAIDAERVGQRGTLLVTLLAEPS